MIPKIIHYVWLGAVEMPSKIKACIASWHKLMPDYEIRRWDEGCIDEIDSDFIKEAIQEKKWAFASDVIRLYALYHHGGIYLDTDVLALIKFDNLLQCDAFAGRENSLHLDGARTINYLTTCCIGASPHHPFIKRCLDYYTNRHFITSTDTSLPDSLRQDQRLNSEVMSILAETIGYNPNASCNYTQKCRESLTVFPSDYFDPQEITHNSHCKHLALGTWRDHGRYEPDYTLSYKLRWRLEKVMKYLMKKAGYILLRQT